MKLKSPALILIALAAGTLAVAQAVKPARRPPTAQKENAPVSEYRKPSDDELRKKLSSQQYEVICNAATEPPFQNAFWNHKEPGIYVDAASGEPLFSSLDKFDSGTGWPSFTQPLEAPNVVEKADVTHGMRRVEVRSKHGDSHLGHVFTDGPGPSGLRYCINSASLRFVPVSQLEAQGYGKFVPLFLGAKAGAKPDGGAVTQQTNREVATLAGGCFWGMEDILRQVPGVLETRVGYTGGALEAPRYENVKRGNTGHAEAIEVVFDPTKISYAKLLEEHFFRMHDPTTVDRQGNDVGTQYRSAIFFHSEEQRRAAEEVKARVDKAGKWKKPVVTQVVPAKTFYAAEDYHQKYLVKNPGGYTCHYMRE